MEITPKKLKKVLETSTSIVFSMRVPDAPPIETDPSE